MAVTVGGVDVDGLFSDLYGGLKDAGNYVYSLGNKPYIVSTTIKFKSSAPAKIPYWVSYKNYLAKATPDGYINSPLKLVFDNAGFATQGSKMIAFDFLWNGHKTVIDNAAYLTVTQARDAFGIDANKAAALRNLNYQMAATTKSLQAAGSKLAALKSNSKLTTEQATLVKNMETKYNATLNKFASTPGVKVSVSSGSLQGLGIIPLIIIGGAALVLTAIAAFELPKIAQAQSDMKAYQAQADEQAKILDTYTAELADPKTTPAEKKQIQSKIDQMYQDSLSNQKSLLQNAESESTSPLDMIEKAGSWLIFGGAVVGGLYLYKTLKPSNSHS